MLYGKPTRYIILHYTIRLRLHVIHKLTFQVCYMAHGSNDLGETSFGARLQLKKIFGENFLSIDDDY